MHERISRWKKWNRKLLGMTVGSSLDHLFVETMNDALSQGTRSYLPRIDEVSERSNVSNSSQSTIRSRGSRKVKSPSLLEKEKERTTSEAPTTIMPTDSASNIGSSEISRTEVLNMYKKLHDENVELTEVMASQLATASNSRQRIKALWDSRTALSEDLNGALEVSGTVLCADGQRIVERVPLLSKSEFVISHTSDRRLNFLISIHVTLLDLLSESGKYPCDDFLLRMSSLTSDPDIWEKYDSQYLDLLLIVLNDTFDFSRARVSNNRFCLPSLEVGMRISEQLLGQCLTDLKEEYISRWNNQFKDVQLPEFLIKKKWSQRTVKTRHGRKKHYDWSRAFGQTRSKR